MKTILIATRDTELTATLRSHCGTAGYSTVTADSGERVVASALELSGGCVVLHERLTDMSGYEALYRIREQSPVPVLVLLESNAPTDRVLALEIGADDCMSPPYHMREVLARMRSVSRRYRMASPALAQEAPLAVGALELVPREQAAYFDGGVLQLTRVEYLLLQYLMENAGTVVQRDPLARQALGRALHPNDRSLDVHVSHLRKKLREAAEGDDPIKTVRGVGYMLVKEEDKERLAVTRIGITASGVAALAAFAV